MCVLRRFSHVQLFLTLRTVACLAPLSVGFSKQEYWSGLPCHLPGDLPDPAIEPASLMSLALKYREPLQLAPDPAARKGRAKTWTQIV